MKHLSSSSSWQQMLLSAMLVLIGQFSFAQQNTITLVNNQNQWAGIVTAAGVPLSVSVDNGTQPQATLMINTFTQPNGLVGTVHSLIGFPNKSLEVRDVSEAPISCGQGGLYVTGIARSTNVAGTTGGPGNMFVALVQANGMVCWYFEHANTSTAIKEEGVSVVTMPNGDVIAVGNTSNAQLAATSVMAARFSPGGAMLWSNYYNCSCTVINPPPATGESTQTYAQGCNLLSREACLDVTGGTGVAEPAGSANGNAGVAIVGNFGNGTAANPNSTMVLDINGAGIEMWRNTYGYNNLNQISYDEGYDIIQDNRPNGNYGFGVAGKAIGVNGANYVYFVSLNNMGGVLCNNVVTRGTANTNNFHARGIQLSNTSGNYILAGPDFVSGRTFAMELGACAVPVWARTYPLTTTGGAPESISKTATGYFITTNAMGTTTAMNQHVLMTDFNGLTGTCISEPMTLVKLTSQHILNLPKCQVVTPLWSPDQPVGTALAVTESPCPAPNPCNPDFHATITSLSLCPNACGTLTASASLGTAPYTFNWSNGVTAPANTVCSPGIYVVTVTDANGCTTTASVAVTANPAPAVTTTNGFIGCTTPCATINATASGTAPFTFLWSNGSTTASTTACVPGIYTVTVTDSNGCTSTGTSMVQGNQGFNVTITGGIITCANPCTTLAASVAGGGTGTFTYNWSSGSTAPTTTACTPGVYTVTVTDAAGCTATASFTVVAAAGAPIVTVSGGPLTCANPCTALTATATGGTSPYIFNWSNGASGNMITTCTPGVYMVTVTDANGCTNIASITLTAPTAPIVAITATGSLGCNPNTNQCVTLAAAATSGTSPYTFSWSNGAATPTTVVCVAGVYTVTVTDANGCTATKSITVTAPTAPIVAITATGSLGCNPTTTQCVTLTAAATSGTSPYTFNWSNGATTPTTVVCVAGVYTVTVTDANGCTATKSITVTAPTAPIATITATGSLGCNPNTTQCVTLTAAATSGTSPYTFNWSNGATTPTTLVCVAGVYTVTVTDANGCTATKSITVTAPAAPIVAITATGSLSCSPNSTKCVTLTAAATSGTSPYTFNWSNGTTTPTTVVCVAGVYTVTVTDANGCTATSSITVTTPAAPIATITATGSLGCNPNTTQCVTLTAAATSGTSPYVFNWSNGATTPTTIVCVAGVYTVTVTDANGCTATKSITVTAPAAPIVAITATGSLSCSLNSTKCVTLTAAATSGTSPYTFSWSNGATTPTTVVCVAGVYTVTVTDANGCTATSSITVTTPAAPIATITATGSLGCNPNTTQCVTLTAAATSGTSPYVFNWSNGATTPTTIVCVAGVYTVTVTDANGCTATKSITVTAPAAPIVAITATGSLSCSPNSTKCVTLTAAATSGTSPYTFSWSNGATTPTTLVCVAGVYTVTVTDANGCTATSSITVTTPAAPIATITATGSLGCNPNTTQCVTLTAAATSGTSPYTFSWSNGAATPTTLVCVAGVYTVTVTDANGCTATKSITVTAPVPATATIVKSGTACPYTLTASGGGTYLWNTGATTATLSAATSGVYTVTVTNSAGCTATASITVDCCNLQITEMRYIVYSYLQTVVFPTPTVTGCATGSVLTYLWEFGDGTTSTTAAPTKTYTNPGVYTVCLTVTCTKADGTFCRMKCCREVNVGKACATLYPTFAYSAPAVGLGVYNFTGTPQAAGVVSTSTYEIYNSANTLVATVAGTNAAYTFPTSGEFTVCRTLTTVADATYGAYCGNKNCRKITVMPTTGCNAAAKFIATVYKSTPLNVTFNASSYSTGATSYYWEYSTTPTGAFTILGTVANASSGTPSFTFPSAGIYWVRLTINKGTACETWVTARLNLTAINCTATASTGGVNPTGARTTNADGSIVVGNSDINDGIALYPNPTEGDVTITFGNDIKATTLIKVYDMKGTLITSYRTQEGENQTTIDLNNQAAGMYLFHIENESGERLVKKVLKQ